jgi:hypothetical protein
MNAVAAGLMSRQRAESSPIFLRYSFAASHWPHGLQGSARYAFGRFVLDLGPGVLLENGEERALRPKSFSLLRHMLKTQIG